MTDPSYAGQIITFTYPHIGNVGINFEDVESEKSWCAGAVMREIPRNPSNYRSKGNLIDYFLSQQIVAIAKIDTRHLTHILRDQGAQSACLMAGEIDETFAIREAQHYSGISTKDWVLEVTASSPYSFQERSWRFRFDEAYKENMLQRYPHSKKIVVYDFGVKQNILRLLADRNLEIVVVPAQTSFAKVQELKPDGIVFSNGPGDPAQCHYAIETIQACLASKISILGICLGSQLLALALGVELKNAIWSSCSNHPVQCLKTGKVFITSQNHGFCIDETHLPDELDITHRSLFDNSIQGVRHKSLNCFAFQGHPEANPGPNDIVGLFDDFCRSLKLCLTHHDIKRVLLLGAGPIVIGQACDLIIQELKPAKH